MRSRASTKTLKRTARHDNGEEIEATLEAKGLNAPRVTPEHIEAVCVDAQYYVFPGTTVTVCCLTLDNGYTVVGEAACASHSNFDEELGRQIALKNAMTKVWALEGYLLRERIHTGQVTEEAP